MGSARRRAIRVGPSVTVFLLGVGLFLVVGGWPAGLSRTIASNADASRTISAQLDSGSSGGRGITSSREIAVVDAAIDALIEEGVSFTDPEVGATAQQ